MPQRFRWDPFTGIVEPVPEVPKPKPAVPPKLTADYADAEAKTKAYLDAVHEKEKRNLIAYEKLGEDIRTARTLEARRYLESLFDRGHNKTVTQRDEEVRNGDTAIKNVWSTFAETWPGTTCKQTTAALDPSSKTYRTVEIESPYLGKKVIGPTKVPESQHLIDESKGGFRALARQPQGFLPQRYDGRAPAGFGHPPSASRPELDSGLSYTDYDRVQHAAHYDNPAGGRYGPHDHDHDYHAGQGFSPHNHDHHHHHQQFFGW